MSWQDRVVRCFGVVDCVFAGHPMDEGQAKELIKEAKQAGASFEDFEKEVVWHCYKELKVSPNHLSLKEHIDKQVNRLI